MIMVRPVSIELATLMRPPLEFFDYSRHLAGGQREPHRQTVGIDHRMYLAGQPARVTVPWTAFDSEMQAPC